MELIGFHSVGREFSVIVDISLCEAVCKETKFVEDELLQEMHPSQCGIK